MKIAIIGTGSVGLVTGVSLSQIGHHVTCIDIDATKIEKMKQGIAPIYEPELEELMKTNMENNRLSFTISHSEGLKDVDVIYIAVNTPENEDGSANLQYIVQAIKDIVEHIKKDAIIVTKSTVPVGTNHNLKEFLRSIVSNEIKVDVVSNPEFLREGSAIYDSFHGDRIVIGADNVASAQIIKEINEPFGIPILLTDVISAEMIKYASNAFLATKITFINEIANISEKVGADIEDVAKGMGLDNRIGSMFLKAGIGYGGSCFPKDTKALVQLSKNVDYDFQLLKAVINKNQEQPMRLVQKAKERFRSLSGKKVGILGLAFKPNTDDMRGAVSIPIVNELLSEGAAIFAYDPVAMNNAKKVLPQEVEFENSIGELLAKVDMLFILTEWQEFKQLDLNIYVEKMAKPIIFDGRNIYRPDEIGQLPIEYHSIGRKPVN